MAHDCLQDVRYGCALHGALRTALEIPGIVPIVHSNAGCAAQGSLSDYASGLGYGPYGGFEIPSTNVLERHVVFGGASRLREQIKNSEKVVEANLYAVLSGCEPAMVGDDIPAMIKEAVGQDIPVFGNETAGFKGLPHVGYEVFMDNLIRAIPLVLSSYDTVPDDQGLSVNLLGIIPGVNVHFQNDLEELSELLNGIGISSNYLFHEHGWSDLYHLPRASLTLVFSKWGVQAARRLEVLFGVPWILISDIPVGPAAVSRFLETVGNTLNLSLSKIQEYIRSREQSFQCIFGRISDYYYSEDIEKKVTIVSDENYARGYADFLRHYLGADIGQIIAADHREEDQSPGEPLKTDPDTIRQSVVDSHSQFILGSALETRLGRELQIACMAVEYPLENQIVLGTTYIGINGALRLAEDYISEVIRHNRKQQQQSAEILFKSDLFGI